MACSSAYCVPSMQSYCPRVSFRLFHKPSHPKPALYSVSVWVNLPHPLTCISLIYLQVFDIFKFILTHAKGLASQPFLPLLNICINFHIIVNQLDPGRFHHHLDRPWKEAVRRAVGRIFIRSRHSWRNFPLTHCPVWLNRTASSKLSSFLPKWMIIKLNDCQVLLRL